jgi:3-hydroxyisobutyrate dehydrogenase-like beta-hydroxyacid dehydrogenase
MTEQRRVGLIGVGRMGEPMGRHWLQAGCALATFDPNPGAAQSLVAAGATMCVTPKAVAEASDVIVVLVGYPAQVAECMNGSDGILAGLVLWFVGGEAATLERARANREALQLAASFNVDADRLRAALLDSSAASWAMAHWDMMEHSPWAHKDMVLTTAMGDQAGLSLPLAGLLREAVKEKWAERDVELPPPGAARR